MKDLISLLNRCELCRKWLFYIQEVNVAEKQGVLEEDYVHLQLLKKLPASLRNPAVQHDYMTCPASWLQNTLQGNWLNWSHHTSEYYISVLLLYRLAFSFPFLSLSAGPSLFLAASVSLLLTFPHTVAPGCISPFLGLFFSHFLRKLSLFLLSSVDSPLWKVMKLHWGILEKGGRSPTSLCCFFFFFF